MSWKAARPVACRTAKPANGYNTERGSAAVEFSLIMVFVATPLLLSVIVFGYNLIRAIQVSEISRASGRMYAYGVDFSSAQSQALLAKIAAPVGITGSNSGKGAVVLSRVQLITAADCAASGQNGCANTGSYVFTSFYVFGSRDPSLAKTHLGNPPAIFLPGGQTVRLYDYLNNPGLQATSIPQLLGQSSQQLAQYTRDGSPQSAFVAETTVNSQIINISGFSNTGSYARSIF